MSTRAVMYYFVVVACLMALAAACSQEPETQSAMPPLPEVEQSQSPLPQEQAAEPAQNMAVLNPYRETLSVQTNWGETEQEFGLIKEEEVEPMGPHTFAVDRHGNVRIIDPVKGNIKEFSAQGEYETQTPVGGWLIDLAIGEQGELFSLETGMALMRAPSGETRSQALSPEIPDVEGYGQGMRFDDAGNLYVCKLQQCYQIGAAIDGTVDFLTPDEQALTIKAGFPISDGKWIRTEWQDDHTAIAQILDPDGAIVQELAMQTVDVFGGVGFLQQDQQGNLYIEVERITADQYVHLEVWKYDAQGQLTSVTELPNDYYTTVYKKVDVDKHGVIHQIITTPEGVKQLTWNAA